MSTTLLKRALFRRPTANHHLLHSLYYSNDPLSSDATVTTAVSILTHHRSNSRWSTLLTLLPDGLTPTQISQITLHLRNNPHLALRFFHFTTRHFHSSSTSLHSYATIIHILARSRQKTRTQTLIKDAICVSGGQTLELFKILVQTYRVCDSAPFVFDLLIKSLLDMNKLDSCVDIFRMLKSRGCHLNVSTSNALISSLSRHRGCFFGYDFYKEVFDQGGSCRILPNVHTFNALMLSFHRDGVLDMVEEVWIEMVKGKCSANCCSYSILIEAYFEDGDIEKAKNVWEELKSKGLELDVVAYNTMIGGYCKADEVSNGEEFYREMVVSGVEGTCVTYQHLLNGYCLAGDVDSAMILYKDMRRKGYCPDNFTVDAVVRMLCEKDCVMEAVGFFMNVMDKADFVARETSYEVMIKGLCGVGKMEEAIKVQAEMVGKGFRPSEDVYGAFINGYMKHGKADVAERLRKEVLGMNP